MSEEWHPRPGHWVTILNTPEQKVEQWVFDDIEEDDDEGRENPEPGIRRD